MHSSLKFVIKFIIIFIYLSFTVCEDNDSKNDLEINFIIDSICENKINTDKIRCQRESISNWDSVDNRERAGCCISWDINDCILEAVGDKCDRSTYKSVKQFLERQNEEKSEGLCSDYPYGSSKCYFPVWAIVLIVIFGLASLLTVCFVGCMIYSKRQASRIGYL
jgi:hypothetical protein